MMDDNEPSNVITLQNSAYDIRHYRFSLARTLFIIFVQLTIALIQPKQINVQFLLKMEYQLRCPICLDNFLPEDTLVSLNCGESFHEKCIRVHAKEY